jgi:medium-chain acyl-[acyl-carrier-protein] hydrolase
MPRVMAPNEPWFRCLREIPGASFRLICFPCAGGNAVSYGAWAAALPPDIELFALQLPGRAERFREPPITERTRLMREVAAAARSLLDRPTVFFGHSLGALLSFELARQLRHQREQMPRRLIVAGRAAPQIPDRDPPIYHLPDDAFIAELQSLGGMPDEVVADRELLEILLPAIRADIFLHESYIYTSEPPLACPITALGGLGDDNVPINDLRAWQDQTAAAFDLHMFEGGHFFVHAARDGIIRMAIDSLMSASGA